MKQVKGDDACCSLPTVRLAPPRVPRRRRLVTDFPLLRVKSKSHRLRHTLVIQTFLGNLQDLGPTQSIELCVPVASLSDVSRASSYLAGLLAPPCNLIIIYVDALLVMSAAAGSSVSAAQLSAQAASSAANSDPAGSAGAACKPSTTYRSHSEC